MIEDFGWVEGIALLGVVVAGFFAWREKALEDANRVRSELENLQTVADASQSEIERLQQTLVQTEKNAAEAGGPFS